MALAFLTAQPCAATPAAAPAATPAAVPEVEPNDSVRQAQEITLPAIVTAGTKPRDRDYFRFQMAQPGLVRIETTAVEGYDLSLRLLDADGRAVLAVDGQPAGKAEEFVFSARRDIHIIEVLSRPPDANAAEAPYTLRVTGFDPAAYEPPREEIKAAIAKGLDFLATRQNDEGWWPEAEFRHGVTGLALMAFAGENQPRFEPVLGRAVGFFKRHYVEPGAHARNPAMEARFAGSLVGTASRHFIYEQAIAVLAMADYVGHRDDDEARAMVAEAVRLLLRSQNGARKPPELGGPIAADHRYFGGWKYHPNQTIGDISASGWCLIALASAKSAGFDIPAAAYEDYIKFYRACFNDKERAFGYDPGGRGTVTNTTVAIGGLSSLLCEGNAECPLLGATLRGIRGALPTWHTEGSRGRHPFYYWYYATRAMYVAGGGHWKRWESVICPLLLKHQNEDGSWDAAEQETKVGTHYTTAIAILILQLCGGNPPAYLKGLDIRTESYPCDRCVTDIEALLHKAARDGTGKEELIMEIQSLIDRYRGGD